MIKLEKVSYVYQSGGPFEKKAVEDVSFEIAEGEFIGLIGHTGSGKSTLIQMLDGLIKPTSGNIYIDGINLCDKKTKMRDVRFKIGLVMQYPEYQLFEETVYKDIAFGPKNMGLASDEIDERVRFAADMVGLKEDILEKSPFDLSGGQKRRVAIAGVIAMQPKILVLDEPTAGLDPAGRDEILYKIKDMHKRMNLTVVLVSHSMEDVAKLADKILVMNKGNLNMFDRTEKIFARCDELERIGLSVPQVTKICNKLRTNGFEIREGIYTIEEAENEILNYLNKNHTD